MNKSRKQRDSRRWLPADMVARMYGTTVEMLAERCYFLNHKMYEGRKEVWYDDEEVHNHAVLIRHLLSRDHVMDLIPGKAMIIKERQSSQRR